MNRRELLQVGTASAALLALGARAASPLPVVDVYKSPTCGCCGAWADHMRRAGFEVRLHVVDDVPAARKRLGMPDAYGSCHTATVGGYVVEGHVPADDVKRLLAARPAAIGLTVPGMPPSAPGMDVAERRDPYQVFLLDKRGRVTVFASYPKA